MLEHKKQEDDYSFYSLFFPFSTKKAIIIIVIIGLIVFFNSLFNGFVGDDEGQITGNALIHSLNNIPLIFHSVLQIGEGIGGVYYKPLTFTLFTILYSLFGPSAFFYHLLQVILHISNSIFVFLLFKKHTRKMLAFFLAILFLIHPINSETVSYLADLQDVLFMFFGLATLKIINLKKTPRMKFPLIIFTLLAAILSKESGFLFFLIVPLYSWLFQLKERMTISISTGASLVIYSFLRFSSTPLLTSGLYPSAISQLDFSLRLLNIPKIIFFYLHLFIFPNTLSLGWNWIVEKPTFVDFYLPLLADVFFLFFILSFMVYLWRKKSNLTKVYVFFSIWFMLGLLLHLQLIPLDATVADRWFYFPLVGLLGIIGVMVNSFHISDKRVKVAAIFITSLFLIVFGIRTMVRNSNFHDNITLYSHDLKIVPNSSVLENALGTAYKNSGNLAAAKLHYQRSIQLDIHSQSWNNLGVIFAETGDLKQAKGYFQKSVQFSNLALGYENLAQFDLLYGSPKDAKQIAEQGLVKYPNKPKLWFILAQAEYKLGNKNEALLAAQKSFQLAPAENVYSFIMKVKQE